MELSIQAGAMEHLLPSPGLRGLEQYLITCCIGTFRFARIRVGRRRDDDSVAQEVADIIPELEQSLVRRMLQSLSLDAAVDRSDATSVLASLTISAGRLSGFSPPKASASACSAEAAPWTSGTASSPGTRQVTPPLSCLLLRVLRFLLQVQLEALALLARLTEPPTRATAPR